MGELYEVHIERKAHILHMRQIGEVQVLGKPCFGSLTIMQRDAC
jgi:hypothetical protein